MFINIEVAFANDKEQLVIPLSVNAGCCIEDAISYSGILTHFPEIDLKKNNVGIFGKVLPLDTVVEIGDRIEIYRSLSMDPKRNRIKRAKKQKQQL